LLKKRGMVALVILMAVVAVLSGCSKGKETESTSTSTSTPVNTEATVSTDSSAKGKDGQFLTVLVEGGSPAFAVVNETADEFKKQSGYEIKVESVPYIGVFDKLNAEMKAKTGAYDVATIDNLWFPTLEKGLAPLDDLMTGDVRGDLIQSLIDGGSVDNKVLGMPVWTNSKILLYRKDLFEDPKEKEAFQKQYGYELKAPTTWKEYREVAKFFTRKDLYGTAILGLNNGDSVASFLDHALQAGAGPLVVGTDGKANVNTKPYVDALDFLTKILREDKSAPEGALTMASGEISQLFWDGKLAMMMEWGHFFVQSNDPAKSKIAGKVGVAPMIKGDAGIGVVPGPWYQVIPSSSKKQDTAKQYLKFIYDHNDLFMKALGVAARTSVFDQFGQQPEDAHLNALKTTLSAKQTQNRPNLVNWNEIESEALVPALQSALSGKATPQEALDKAAKLINEIQGQ
jgi:multiple sugar transport system substrate-binding protein